LRQSNNIRKSLAFVLLLLFSMSMAPKVFFHDVLANHEDRLVCRDIDKSTPHIHQPAFHCSFDDLVVSSPYVFTEFCPSLTPLVFSLPSAAGLITVALSAPFLHRESRGPPLT
jgi:hypothetical protein